MTIFGRSARRLAPVALSLLLLLLLLAPATAVASPPRVGQPAPAFRLRDRAGTLISLADLAYPGAARRSRPKHVVLLDFFRTDCKPCRASMHKLVALHKKLRARAVKVMLVALLEDKQGERKLARYLSSAKLPFVVLVDRYGIAARAYVQEGRTISIPSLFLIDKRGVLRRRIRGRNDAAFAALRKEIAKLLAH
ncbi:MAG: TlpA family protein disulfide reductase [Myxococcales bacterium]|nr:TlpA family protein disulfide reductase [Myxococcales bacterium]